MATPAQKIDPETTGNNVDNGIQSLRSKNEHLASLELPERLLVSVKDDFEGNNHVSTSTEPPAEALSAEIARIEEEEEEENEAVAEEHAETVEDFFTRDREISSCLTDNHESTTGPSNEKERLPNYRPTLILRSHRRGVAAVRFSPDGRKIASCCMSSLLYLEPVRTS